MSKHTVANSCERDENSLSHTHRKPVGWVGWHHSSKFSLFPFCRSRYVFTGGDEKTNETKPHTHKYTVWILWSILWCTRPLCFRPFWFQLNENVYKWIRICEMVVQIFGCIGVICEMRACYFGVYIRVSVSFVANFRWRLSVWLCWNFSAVPKNGNKQVRRMIIWKSTQAHTYLCLCIRIRESTSLSNACVRIRAIVMGKTL